MVYLIKGTPDSGKSKRAEELVCCISADDRYYIATMIPYGEEGRQRVEKHRRMRNGKGFITLEYAHDICEAADRISNTEQATVLVECVSNLVANLYFGKGYDKKKVVSMVRNQIETLGEKVANLVVVTNEFEKDNQNYDGETVEYIELMSEVNKEIEAVATRVEVMGNEIN